MDINTLLTILLIIVSVFGTILIPTVIGLIRLYSQISSIIVSQKTDQANIKELSIVMGQQAKDLNERKLDIVLIKKDVAFIKDSISGLTNKIDVFIDRIDREISIHNACPNYLEAKRKIKGD